MAAHALACVASRTRTDEHALDGEKTLAQESYHSLTRKTHTFFKTVLRMYAPAYIMKVDDDVYLQLDRLQYLVPQYQAMGNGESCTSHRAAPGHSLRRRSGTVHLGVRRRR